MKRSLHFIAAILCFALSGSPALAVDTGIADRFPSIMRGVRPLGMGNAFIAMPGTDFIAPFYNPAAINDYDETRKYNVGAPMADFNQAYLPSAFDLLKLKRDIRSSMPTNEKIALFNRYSRKYTGQYNELLTSMDLFQVMHKRYLLSAVGDFRNTLSFGNVAFPKFDFKASATMGIVAGSARAFLNDTLQVGANAKLLFRMSREVEVTSADVVVNTLHHVIGFEHWQKGIGFGLDLGAKYKLPVFQSSLRPVIALVIQDVVKTFFTGNASALPMSVSAGIGIFPRLGKVDLAIVADLRELNRSTDFLNKFHFGVEATLPEIKRIRTKFTLRAGCNQGYPSAGLTARWPLVSYLFAFYGEEIGESTHTKPSWRLSNQLSFDF